MIVVGNAKFVENDAMSEPAANFFLGGLNWLLEREALIGIAPKQVKNFSLNVPDDQMRLILGTMVFGCPACAAVWACSSGGSAAADQIVGQALPPAACRQLCSQSASLFPSNHAPSRGRRSACPTTGSRILTRLFLLP